MGNILMLLGIALTGAGLTLNIFQENKPAAKSEVKPEVKPNVEIKPQGDPGAAAAGLPAA